MNSALTFRRWAVIIAAALTGVLVLISMFIDPAPAADGKDLIKGYAENDEAQGLHTNVIHYGFALLAPVAYAIVGLVRGRGAWIANIAGFLAILGLSTLPGLVLIDYASVAAEHVVGLNDAFAIQEKTEELPYFLPLLIPAMFSSLLALPLATIALVRARLAPWWLPVVLVAGFGGVMALPWLPGFSLMAVAGLVLAWALWRIPIERWYPDVEPAVVAAD